MQKRQAWCLIGILLLASLFWTMPIVTENMAGDEKWDATNKYETIGQNRLVVPAGLLEEYILGTDENASFVGESVGDESGDTVAGAGDVNGDGYDDILIGACKNDEGGADAGKTYLFYGNSSGGWKPGMSLECANAVFVGEDAGDMSGCSIASAGDVNGDGYDDILIGAEEYSQGGGEKAGKAYLFFGNDTAHQLAGTYVLGTHENASFVGKAAYDLLGKGVAGVGDVNGDGFDDFLIGAWGNDEGGTNYGATYLFYGNASGEWNRGMNPSIANATFFGQSYNDYSGEFFSGIGDVNNDGFDDFLIGVPVSGGRTYLFYGNDTAYQLAGTYRLGTHENASFLGEETNDYSGRTVAGAGDVNGDNYDDFLIGAYFNGEGGYRAGKTYLFYGNASGGWSKGMSLRIANATFIGEAAWDFSTCVAGAGDVNGDGYSDFLIGADGNDDGGDYAGKTYLFYGNNTAYQLAGTYLLGTHENASFIGQVACDSSGECLAGVGDINNDGFDDFLIGAYNNDDGGSTAGKSYLFLGNEFVPPAIIQDLAVSLPTVEGFTLTWTAPGDDGTNGKVSSYVLKYSTAPITTENFDAATNFDTTGWSSLLAAGGAESRVVTGLKEHTRYYFALKGKDDQQLLGAISNVPNGTTIDGTAPTITSPADITFVSGATGNSILWTITDPTVSIPTYTVFSNGTTLMAHDNESWASETSLIVNLDSLEVGIYNYTIIATDGNGHSVSDQVVIAVEPGKPDPTPFYIIIGGTVTGLGCVGGLTAFFWARRKRALRAVAGKIDTLVDGFSDWEKNGAGKKVD